MSRRIESLKFELEKAKLLKRELEVMLEHKLFGSVIHTLYYACFHLTKALLLTKDLVTKTHKGVETHLYQNFVQTGEFEREKSSFFKTLMARRIDSDYGEEIISEESEIRSLLEPANAYFSYVAKMVEDYLAQNNEGNVPIAK